MAESDGTAIFYQSHPSGGTELTLLCCIKGRKPYKLIDIDLTTPTNAARLLSEFIAENQIRILNVAGPRASSCPSVYSRVHTAISAALLLDSDLER